MWQTSKLTESGIKHGKGNDFFTTRLMQLNLYLTLILCIYEVKVDRKY